MNWSFCPNCEGTGWVDSFGFYGFGLKPCVHCNGLGTIEEPPDTPEEEEMFAVFYGSPFDSI